MALIFYFLLFGTKSRLWKNPENSDENEPNRYLLMDKYQLSYEPVPPNPKLLGKPLNTMTPKPSFTRFVKRQNQHSQADLPLPFPKDEESSDSIKEEIKKQLVSTPMLVFYGLLAVCVIVACGLFMFCSESEDEETKMIEEQQQAALEEQLNETLDPQLHNEAPLQI